MRLSLIVAWADEQVIGRENALPWRLPADLADFKRRTMGHHLILGRRTWESIGRPLPGRKMIVISRTSPQLPESVQLAPTLEGAVEMASRAGDDEAFVAGGASIYAQALPLADRIYLTRIQASVEGDTYFPPVDWSEWTRVESAGHPADDKNPYPYRFEIWERLEPGSPADSSGPVRD